MGQELHSHDFDGYHRWLAIPKCEQPPHHYRLLGVSLFEENMDVIATAAEARLTTLRQQQFGPQAGLCTQLLNEVAQARLCLLNPKRKYTYDLHLTESLQPERFAGGDLSDGLAQIAVSAEDYSPTGSRPSRNSQSPLGTIVGALLGAATFWLLVWQLNLVPWGQGVARPVGPPAKTVAKASTATESTKKKESQKATGAVTRDASNPFGIEGRLIAANDSSSPDRQSTPQSTEPEQPIDDKHVTSTKIIPVTPTPSEIAKIEAAPSRATLRREAWDSELRSFEASKREADNKFVGAFDKVIANIKKSKKSKSWPIETRNQYVTEVRSEKALFQTNRILPKSDLLLPSTVEYLNLLLTISVPLRRTFHTSLEGAQGNAAEYDRISQEKQKWEARLLPGRDQFVSSTKWRGTRTFSTGTAVDFHVNVFQIEGNSIKGSLWQDTRSRSKAGWEFQGKLEGNAVALTTTKMLYGKARQLDLQGFVIDHRLVFRTIVNGTPSNDFVNVSRQ